MSFLVKNGFPYFLCFRNYRFACVVYRQGFQNQERLDAHMQSSSPSSCDRCGKAFCHQSKLRQHKAFVHFGGGGGSSGSSLMGLDEVIVGHTSYQDRAEYEEVLEEHRNVIRSQDINHSLWRRVNRQIDPGFTYRDLNSLLNEIMSTEVSAFRINLGFGVVLYHLIQQEYRYFYISNGHSPFQIDEI